MKDESFPFELTLFTAFVLRVLLQAPDKAHHAAQVFTDIGLTADTAYTFGSEKNTLPTLIKLAENGWLTEVPDETDPKVTGGPRRKYYKLTAQGKSEGQRYLEVIRGHLF